MEEDLWCKEALVADVDLEGLLRDVVDSLVHLEPLLWLCVVFDELFLDVWRDVAVTLLRLGFGYRLTTTTFIVLATSYDCSAGMFGSRSRRSCCTK